LQASSNTLAAAEMQNLLKVILEQNNANLVSAQVMNENKEELYPRITVRAFVKTDIEGLRSMLYALSTNSPLLIVDNINIQKRQGSQTDDMLDIRFEISGYIKSLEAA
ncbi:MAG: type II secretion system protein GspM, partial [Gammaproteobacteria bacterium]